MLRSIRCWAMLAIAVLAPALARADETQDKQTAQEIAAALRASGRLQNYSVGVKYKDGTVWLSGRVANQEQLNTTLQLVADMEADYGIGDVVNNLTVVPAAPQRATRASVEQPAAPPKARNRGAQPLPAARLPVAQGPGAGYSRLAAQAEPQMMPAPRGPARPLPAYAAAGGAVAPASYDEPYMPNYSWPSYAAYPNYAAVTYPKQYSASAWPFIGPFYPYPQVPMGWRKVSLEWDDGWWFLDFNDRGCY